MRYLKRLKARHIAWATFLAIVGIWWPIFVMTTPPDFLQQAVLPSILIICMSTAVIGTVIKIAGYLGSQSPGKIGVISISIELAGLILAAVGPGSYIVASLFGFFDPAVTISMNSAFIFACALFVVYIFRAMIIVPRFFFEGHDPAKEE